MDIKDKIEPKPIQTNDPRGFAYSCAVLAGLWYELNLISLKLLNTNYRLVRQPVQVTKVSDTLEQVSNHSAIAPGEKQKIKQLTEATNVALEQVEQEFEIETEKLE